MSFSFSSGAKKPVVVVQTLVGMGYGRFHHLVLQSSRQPGAIPHCKSASAPASPGGKGRLFKHRLEVLCAFSWVLICRPSFAGPDSRDRPRPRAARQRCLLAASDLSSRLLSTGPPKALDFSQDWSHSDAHSVLWRFKKQQWLKYWTEASESCEIQSNPPIFHFSNPLSTLLNFYISDSNSVLGLFWFFTACLATAL